MTSAATRRKGPETRIALSQLAHLLSKAVGDENALEVVETACRTLRLATADGLALDDALSVLEKIAEQPGLLGVTARFAKSRLHLSLL